MPESTFLTSMWHYFTHMFVLQSSQFPNTPSFLGPTRLSLYPWYLCSSGPCCDLLLHLWRLAGFSKESYSFLSSQLRSLTLTHTHTTFSLYIFIYIFIFTYISPLAFTILNYHLLCLFLHQIWWYREAGSFDLQCPTHQWLMGACWFNMFHEWANRVLTT